MARSPASKTILRRILIGVERRLDDDQDAP
jgi:hypothetical protein